MEIVSKELYEAVYDKTLEELNLDLDDLKYIDINAFYFKCKEWAYTQGYNLKSEIAGCLMCQRTSFMGSDEEWFNGSSEIEAVIKACEYILQQTKKGI